MFDVTDPRAALDEVTACREAFPDHYVMVTAFDNRKGRETIALSFGVQHPATEPAFRLGAPGPTGPHPGLRAARLRRRSAPR